MEYFQKNNIKSIQLKGQELVIEYNDNKQETKLITASSELQQIHSYCQTQGLTSLTFSQLQEQEGSNKQPTNYLGWGLTITLITLVGGLIGWWVMRNKNKGISRE